MKYLKSYRFIFVSAFILLLLLIIELSINHAHKIIETSYDIAKKALIPDVNDLSDSPQDDMIRYGRQLVINTSKYLGPHGTVAQITNGLNCGNCHLQGGTKLYTNNFLAVASTYPKFRARSGRLESIEYRVNECLQRSLDGSPVDSLSKEMQAMVAYIRWTGKNISKITTPEGVKNKELPLSPAAALPLDGAVTYAAKCKLCHGEKGEGLVLEDSLYYLYPPLWGKNSYAVSAGMYRITKLASFIKYNMPNGASYKTPQLTDGEAWNLAAYINSQPHPIKFFARDWPLPGSQPVDYPFGPYTDTFSAIQHKYGPFTDIQKAHKP